jgi:hypothetical protein
MRAPADTAGSSGRTPEAEEPKARSLEQELASGRTAATPAVILLTVIVTIACLVLVVAVLAVLAYTATDTVS